MAKLEISISVLITAVPLRPSRSFWVSRKSTDLQLLSLPPPPLALSLSLLFKQVKVNTRQRFQGFCLLPSLIEGLIYAHYIWSPIDIITQPGVRLPPSYERLPLQLAQAMEVTRSCRVPLSSRVRRIDPLRSSRSHTSQHHDGSHDATKSQ